MLEQRDWGATEGTEVKKSSKNLEIFKIDLFYEHISSLTMALSCEV